MTAVEQYNVKPPPVPLNKQKKKHTQRTLQPLNQQISCNTCLIVSQPIFSPTLMPYFHCEKKSYEKKRKKKQKSKTNIYHISI